MDFAGGHDARTRPAGNSLDVAGPTPAVPPARPQVVNATATPATPSAAPSASSGGAACPLCGSQIDALALATSGMRLVVAALACRACGWGTTRADLRHIKPLPEAGQ